MASTYTANLGIEKPGSGEQSGTWGTTTNTNFDIIDRAINGVLDLSLTGTTTTLTTSDGSLSDGGYKVLVLGGSPSGTNTITISPNDQDKLYLVHNNTGQSAVFTQGSGSNATVPAGDFAWVFADGAGSGAAVTLVTVDTSQLADSSITSAKIADGTIATADIADDAVTSAKIADNAVALATQTTGNFVATIAAGSGMSVSGSGSENAAVTVAHDDTSSQASSNNSGRTYIQDITLDTFGHVTGIATATETVVDTNTTYTADGNYGMTLSGTAFRLENDRRRNATNEDVISGNTHDYTFYDADVGIRWYTAGAEEMRLEDDGDLHVDGNITAYSTTVSDPRLKEDIQPVTDALAKVEKLNGYTFTYKHDGSHSAGVVSTEVADVLPSAIRKSKVPLVAGHDNETEYDIVQYDQLHALLIEAVKELSERVRELEDGR